MKNTITLTAFLCFVLNLAILVVGQDEAELSRLIKQMETRTRPEDFSKVYAYYLDQGKLDELTKRYQERASRGDGVALLILGMIHQKAGHDSEALAAFSKAEEKRPQDYWSVKLHASALLRVGQRAEATQALERALERKPTRNELLATAGELTRLYQRAGQPEKVRAMLQKLEPQLPDRAFGEKIATLLAEEKLYPDAIKKLEKLLIDEPTPTRKIALRMQAAELMSRDKQESQARTEYESLLTDLDPHDHRYREVRRRIENLILGSDNNKERLETYYRQTLTKQPDDSYAYTRLIRLMIDRGNLTEALKLLDDGIKKDPASVLLRKQKIDLLEQENRLAEAVKECESFDKVIPNKADLYVRWGQLVIRCGKPTKEASQQAALAIWKRLLPAEDKPESASALGQVADLCRQASMPDEAVGFYQRAVKAAPHDPSPREALGEYFHTINRPQEALAAWMGLVEGARRTPDNLSHLAEVLSNYHRTQEAVGLIKQACELKPTDFSLHARWISLLQLAGKPEEALTVSPTLQKLAATPDEKNRALETHLRLLRDTSQLSAEIARLARVATSNPQPAQWYLLARHYEEDRKWAEAKSALASALASEKDLDQQGLLIPAHTTAARIAEASGDLAAAGEATRKLSERDPKNRMTHLRKVAKLEATRGRSKEAYAAAQLVVQDAPTDPSRYRFLAEIAFNLGMIPDGLAALRSAVRVAPNDPDALNALADALAERFQPLEALEVIWRSFDLAPPERKPAVARKLADVARRLDQADSIVHDIERRLAPSDNAVSIADSTDQRRIVALCCAQAEVALSRLPAARKRLENLLPEQPDDADLLGQMVDLAEKDGDLQAALQYQRQRHRQVPQLAQKKLTELLLESGEIDEAVKLWGDKYKSAKETTRQLEFIDNLLFYNRYDEVLALLTPALRESPTDWELLYRRGFAEERLGKSTEAKRSFESLLALRHSDDDLSKLQEQGAEKKKEGEEEENPVIDRVYTSSPKIRVLLGLDSQRADRETGERKKELWTPADFGQARMAALAWLVTLAGREGRSDAFMAELQAACRTAKQGDFRPWMDAWYLSWVMKDQAARFNTASHLLTSNVHAVLFYFLEELQERGDNPSSLTSKQLEMAIQAYHYLLEHQRDWISTRPFFPLAKELTRAGRDSEREQLYRKTLKALSKNRELAEAIGIAAENKDSAEVIRIFNVLDDKPITWKEFLKSDPSSKVNTLVAEKIGQDASEDALRVLTAYYDAHLQRWWGSRRDNAPLKPEEVLPLGAITHPVSGTNAQLEVELPVPNRFISRSALSSLAVAYVVFKHQGLEDDLLDWARARVKKASPDFAPVEHQLLSALLWWDDQRDAAVREMEQASKLIPNNFELILSRATMLSQLNRPEESIAVLDQYTPLTPAERQKKEWTVLEQATKANNRQRAARSAEALSELRLSPEDEARLCVELARADKPDLAKRSLERLRIAAAGRPVLMLRGMRLARDRGQQQEAIDLAFAILRAVPQPVAPDRNPQRDEALRILHQYGRLQPLIARAESYRKTSPQSKTVYNELAEYYRAKNDLTRAREVSILAVAQRKTDLQAQLGLATQLKDDGRTKEAVPYYLAALRQQPRLFYNQTTELIQTFQEAGALPQLAKALLEVDQKTIWLGDARTLIEELWKDQSQYELGLKLLSRAWPAGMATDSSLYYFLRTGSNESRWKQPGIYELAFARLITDAVPESAGEWAGLGRLLHPLLEEAIERKQLTKIREQVLKNCKERPWWKAGSFLRAWLQHLDGKYQEAYLDLQQLLATTLWDSVPEDAQDFVIQELSKDESLSKLLYPLVRKEFQKCIREKEFQRLSGTKAQLYLKLAIQQNELQNVQKDLIETMKLMPLSTSTHYTFSNGIQSEYIEGNRQRQELASAVLSAGRPLEALSSITETVDTVLKTRPQSSDYTKRLNIEYRAALNAIEADMDGNCILDQLNTVGNQNIRLHFVEDGERTLILRSAILDAVGALQQPAARQAALQRLHEIEKSQPDSLAPQLLLAVLSLSDGQPEAAEKLRGWMKAHPLATIPEGRHPSAQNRRQATEQTALWLIAIRCLNKEPLRALGRELAERALAAADRLPDRRIALAIARHWAILESKIDSTAATRRWQSLIDRVLAGSTTGQGKIPLSLTSIESAFGLSEELVNAGFTDLSVNLIQRAFAPGRPRPDAGRDSRDMDQLLYQLLERQESIWRQHGVPCQKTYVCLRDIMLPVDQPDRINDDGIVDISQGNKTTGMILVALAMESGQAEDLKKRLIEREKHAGVSKEARGLLLHLCRRTNDLALARQLLDRSLVALTQQGGEYGVVSVMYEAGPFLSHAELSKQSREILKKGVENYRAGNSGVLVDRMTYALSKSYLQSGELDAAQRHFAEYIESGDTQRYRNPAQYRRSKAIFVARTWAENNHPKQAWDAYASAVDLPTVSRQSTDDASVLAPLAKFISSVPPLDRYQQLKTWTIRPGGNPRFGSGFFENSSFPLVFGQPPLRGYVDTFTWLLDAAQESKQLDDLQATLKPLTNQKVDRAWPMLLAVQARAEQSNALEATYLAWRKYRGINDEDKEGPKPFSLSGNPVSVQLEYLAARECLRTNPQSRASQELLIAFETRKTDDDTPYFFESSTDSVFETKLAVEFGSLPQYGIKESKEALDSGELPLTNWLISGHGRPFAFLENHLYSPRVLKRSRLAWPVVGDFDFHFDSYYSVNIGYGGWTFPLESMSYYGRGYGSRLEPEYWNRCILRSKGGQVTLLVNNQEIFPWRPINPSVPFILVTPEQTQASSILIRNVALTGQPTIPASVDLLQTKLQWTKEKVVAKRPSFSSRFDRPTAASNVPSTWKINKDHELVCTRLLSDQPKVEYLIYEAMGPGESVSYDFFYEPGKTMVHPTWGDLAFILTAEEVRLHWRLSRTAPGLDLGPGKTVSSPTAERRGKGALPLKVSAWNTIKLDFRGKTLALVLNDQLIYEHVLDPGQANIFGLFCFAQNEEGRVRNVKMQGSWPSSIPKDLLATRAPLPSSTVKQMRTRLKEEILEGNVVHFIKECSKLSDEERFTRLRSWVIPEDDRPTYRLTGMTGEEGLVSPGDELLDLAIKLKRLESVAGPTKDRPLAWQTMWELAAGQTEQARLHLIELAQMKSALLEKTLWPAYWAARRGLNQSATREASLQLLSVMAKIFEPVNPPKPLPYALKDEVARLQARATLSAQAQPWADPEIEATQPGTQQDNQWYRQDDVLFLLNGSPGASLNLPFPLVGNFNLSFQSQLKDAMSISFGGQTIHIEAQAKKILRGDAREGMRPILLEPPITIETKETWVETTVSVNDKVLKITLAGRTVFEQPLSSHHNPWFSLSGKQLSIKAFRFQKTPMQLPGTLQLTNDYELNGWTSSQWRWQAKDIVMTHSEYDSGSELSMSYQRPVPLQAVIEYDFFYQPGQSEVMPKFGEKSLNLAELSNKALIPHRWNSVRIQLMPEGYDIQVNGQKLPLVAGKLKSSQAFSLVVPVQALWGRFRSVRLAAPWKAPVVGETLFVSNR